MKAKIICLAAAIAAAGAITAVAVAQGSGEEFESESVSAVESAVVSDVDTENESAPEDMKSNESDNSDVSGTESEAADSEIEADESAEEANAPESAPAYTYHEGVTTTVDPVDNRVTYTFDADAEGKPYTRYWSGNDEETEEIIKLRGHNESNEASLEYLEEFFGTDSLPVDERFKGGIEREYVYGQFVCDVAEGAKAYSPVEGSVVIATPVRFNGGLGAIVAVEFDNKIFIMAHLDEVYVEVGDTVSAGQALGVCGHTGDVYVGDPPLMRLIPMIVED